MAQAIANRRTRQISAAAAPSRRARRRTNGAELIRFVVLCVLAVTWAAPVLWMLLTSLKPENQIITTPPHWLPQHLSDFTIASYLDVILQPRGIDLVQAFRNSVAVSTLGTLLVVIVDVLAGYTLARMHFPGRNLLFVLIVASLIVPSEIYLIPNYVTVWQFGWLNTINALIFPPAANCFGVFLMRQFMLGIPQDLEDAAQIDGCGRWRILWSIVLPLSRGAVATLAVFTFLGMWNDFTWPYIVTNEASRMTLPVALIQFKGDYWSTYGSLMAGTAISALPAIVIFLLAQRLIIRSITLTGVKG